MHWRPCSEPSTSRQWSTGIKLGRCSELLVLNMSRSLAPSVLFFSLYWGDLWNMLVQALLGISIHSWVSWPGLRKPCHAMPCHAMLEITWDHSRPPRVAWNMCLGNHGQILVPSLNLSPVSCPVFFCWGDPIEKLPGIGTLDVVCFLQRLNIV